MKITETFKTTAIAETLVTASSSSRKKKNFVMNVMVLLKKLTGGLSKTSNKLIPTFILETMQYYTYLSCCSLGFILRMYTIYATKYNALSTSQRNMHDYTHYYVEKF